MHSLVLLALYLLIGRFYGEFMSYSGGDGQTLGIILTPRHITDLFCELLEISPHDKVLEMIIPLTIQFNRVKRLDIRASIESRSLCMKAFVYLYDILSV